METHLEAIKFAHSIFTGERLVFATRSRLELLLQLYPYQVQDRSNLASQHLL